MPARSPGPTPTHRADSIVYLVCPHCKMEVNEFFVSCDGHIFTVQRCVRHGDVVAIRSHVRNQTILEAADGLR